MREKPAKPNAVFSQQGRITGGQAACLLQVPGTEVVRHKTLAGQRACGCWLCIPLTTTFVLGCLLLLVCLPAGIQQINDSQLLSTAGDGRLMVWDLRNASAGPVNFAVPDSRCKQEAVFRAGRGLEAVLLPIVMTRGWAPVTSFRDPVSCVCLVFAGQS